MYQDELFTLSSIEGEEQNREEGEIAQKKSWEEGEIGSQSRGRREI